MNESYEPSLIQAQNAQLTNEQTLLFIFWVCF